MTYKYLDRHVVTHTYRVTREWSHEEAWKAQEAFQKQFPNHHWDPTGPLFQRAELDEIENERKRFVKGDRMALLAAVARCASHGLVMPAWVSDAFENAYRRVLHCEVGSWDKAFGRPYKKNSNLEAMRRRRFLGVKVWLAVTDAQKAGRSISDGLFEDIGKTLTPPISASTARGYFYAKKREIGARASATKRRGERNAKQKRRRLVSKLSR